MRDIAFVAFLFAFIGVGFRKPFLFVLAYCYIDIVAPQRLSYFLINSIPISLIVFALAILGWLTVDDKRDTRWSGRQTLMVMLSSAERRVGKECVSSCRSRRSPYH